MDVWYPAAQRDLCPDGKWGATFTPTRGVLHTTESRGGYRPAGNGTYFGHQSFPHFTVSRGQVWQHIPLDRSARALANAPGGVETNRLGAVQIEVDWNAADAANLPDDTTTALAALVAWINTQTGIPAVWTGKGVHDYPPEGGHRLGREPWRMTFAEWTDFRGWCGHCHVPENDHGDPGRIPTDRIFTNQEDDDMPLNDADKAWITQAISAATTPIWQQLTPRGGAPIRDVVEQTLNAATVAATRTGAAPVDPAALAAAIAGTLGTDVAKKVSDELAKRLAS